MPPSFLSQEMPATRAAWRTPPSSHPLPTPTATSRPPSSRKSRSRHTHSIAAQFSVEQQATATTEVQATRGVDSHDGVNSRTNYSSHSNQSDPTPLHSKGTNSSTVLPTGYSEASSLYPLRTEKNKRTLPAGQLQPDLLPKVGRALNTSGTLESLSQSRKHTSTRYN